MKERLTTGLKIVVSLALIAWIFSRVDLAEVGRHLASAKIPYLLAAVVVYLAAIVVNGVKWQILLRAQKVAIPFPALLRFLFIGFFFNNLLPANVGGDVMRGYGLARYTDRAAEAAVSVVVDRIIGLMAYLSTAAIAAIVAVNFAGFKNLQQVEWLAFAALLAVGLLFAAFMSRRLRGIITRILSWRFLARLAPVWKSVSNGLNAYRFNYGALLSSLLVALVGIACTTLVNWLLSQSMGGHMPLLSILMFNPLIALVLMIPISIGGLGVSQNIYPFFYSLVGVPDWHSLAVSLVMQLVVIAGGLPGGILWLRRRSSPPAGA